MSDDAWEQHRLEVEAAKGPRERFKYRKTAGRGKLPLRIRNLKKYTTSELHGELGRRRRRFLEERTPELLVEQEKKRDAVRAIRRENCDHKKLAPKLRASGPSVGLWCCPSCNAEVDPPEGK